MKSRSTFPLFAAACALFLALPAAAQNLGGLPGPAHVQGLVAYRHADRTVLSSDNSHDIVHYRFDVVVGSGRFDTVRIHRVVKETKARPNRPVPNMEGILLLAGAPQLFEYLFMDPTAPSDQRRSFALFLAANGVDVWGMDYGWSFVPYGTTDFTALKGWGIDKDAVHAQITLSFARWMRATSGQGNGPIHLLGFTYGGFLAYAVASNDSQRPGNLKNVKGIVTVDGGIFKTNVPALKDAACNSLPKLKADLEAGKHHDDRSFHMLFGRAALDRPYVLWPENPPLRLRSRVFPAASSPITRRPWSPTLDPSDGSSGEPSPSNRPQ